MSLNRTLSITAVLCTVFVFASCAPVPRDFYKPAYKGGSLVSRGCGSSGPQDTVKILLESGVKVQIRASSGDSHPELANFYLDASLTAAEGVEFQLLTDYIIVKDNNSPNRWKLKVNYLSTNKENYPGPKSLIIDRTFNGLSLEQVKRVKESDSESGYISVPVLSKLNGKTHSYEVAFGRKRYFDTGMSFSIHTSEIKSRLESFSIFYPEIVINGKRVVLGEVRFDRVQYIGIDPLNC